MELHLEVAIHQHFRVLREVLLTGPDSWLPAVRNGSGRNAHRPVRLDLLPSKLPPVGVGSARQWHDGVEVPVAWQGADEHTDCAAFAGTLRIEQLVNGECRLRLDGRCQTPLRPLDASPDPARVHRDAHATARDFFNRVATVFGSWSRSDVRPDQVAGGPR